MTCNFSLRAEEYTQVSLQAESLQAFGLAFADRLPESWASGFELEALRQAQAGGRAFWSSGRKFVWGDRASHNTTLGCIKQGLGGGGPISGFRSVKFAEGGPCYDITGPSQEVPLLWHVHQQGALWAKLWFLSRDLRPHCCCFECFFLFICLV